MKTYGKNCKYITIKERILEQIKWYRQVKLSFNLELITGLNSFKTSWFYNRTKKCNIRLGKVNLVHNCVLG